jgi:hypothetical protein
MPQPFIFVTTYRIKEGKADAFRSYAKEVSDFVEENEPRLIAFNFYVNDAGSEGAIVHVHPDGDSMEVHMGVIGEHMQRSSEFLDGDISVQLYGPVAEATLEKINRFSDVPVTAMRQGIAGFTRSAAA